MREERVVSYKIEKKGRKYWSATHAEKNWKAQIVIDDITKVFEVGGTYTFLASLSISKSKYGTKVTVTALSMEVSSDQEKEEAIRSIENITAYIEKKASKGEWHSMGVEKLEKFDPKLVAACQDRIDAARTLFERKSIAQWIAKAKKYAKTGYYYSRGIEECEALGIEKYSDLSTQLDEAKHEAGVKDAQNHFDTAKTKILKRHKESDNSWYKNSNYFRNDLSKCEESASKMKRYDEDRAKEMEADIQSLRDQNSMINTMVEGEESVAAFPKKEGDDTPFDLNTLSLLSDTQIQNLSSMLKETLYREGYGSMGHGIDTTHEERDDDYTTYSYYHVSEGDLKKIREHYPFDEAKADQEAIRTQNEKIQNVKKKEAKRALQNFLNNNDSQVRYGNTLNDTELTQIQSASAIPNPLAAPTFDADHFVDIGDGLLWHYCSFWADGRYENYVAYDKTELERKLEAVKGEK